MASHEGSEMEPEEASDYQNIMGQSPMSSYPLPDPPSEQALPLPDPMMRQAYAMPPAGLPARQNHDHYYTSPSAAAGRQYRMASDIFGTGMGTPWDAPPSPQRSASGTFRKEPTSFKITESSNQSMASTEYQQPEPEPASNFSSGNRRTRESAGNPLTGQGYDSGNTKTAKRYFEGSNANQKLW